MLIAPPGVLARIITPTPSGNMAAPHMASTDTLLFTPHPIFFHSVFVWRSMSVLCAFSLSATPSISHYILRDYGCEVERPLWWVEGVKAT